MSQKFSLFVEIIDDPNIILKYLHLGINIPILHQFHKYIIGAFNAYKAKGLFLYENIDDTFFKRMTDKVAGISLIYSDGRETLFFGFCGVYDHDKKKIQVLVEEIIKYAKMHNFKYIRGPVNIPAMIFGWGFMVPGSSKKLFIGCPINPPVYQLTFLENQFYIKFEEDRYDVIVIKLNPFKLKGKNGKIQYDFSEYEYHNPKKEEIPQIIDDFINLHIKYMPPSAQISPQHRYNAEAHHDFIHNFGTESMIWTVYYKPKNEMVACGFIIPNPFSRDNKGRINSASFHDWVVHPDHRNRGLAMFMYGCTSKKVYSEGLRWGSWPVGADNIANAAVAIKMGGLRDRRHLILEYKI
ncbi:MAG: hypothetical protein ACFE85_11905 [Candidatus Hodarchaeota archaeon]